MFLDFRIFSDISEFSDIFGYFRIYPNFRIFSDIFGYFRIFSDISEFSDIFGYSLKAEFFCLRPFTEAEFSALGHL